MGLDPIFGLCSEASSARKGTCTSRYICLTERRAQFLLPRTRDQFFVPRLLSLILYLSNSATLPFSLLWYFGWLGLSFSSVGKVYIRDPGRRATRYDGRILQKTHFHRSTYTFRSCKAMVALGMFYQSSHGWWGISTKGGWRWFRR